MKSELKRIEATLGQLNPSGGTPPLAEARLHPLAAATSPPLRPSLPAFPLSPTAADAPPSTIAPSTHAVDAASRPAARPAAPQTSAPVVPGQAVPVQAFPVQGNPKRPALPRSKPPSISSHRHAANPSLAVSLLKEIEAKVTVWQQELEQIIQQIRSLYEEGPIVDGWLESHAPHSASQGGQSVKLSTLRHVEVDRLMDFIEEICSAKPAPSEETASTSYRLCGLDADGQLWSRPCPAPQVPYVSLAIARYQKLRILLDQKQTLENRLQQLVQTLTLVHGQIEDPQ